MNFAERFDDATDDALLTWGLFIRRHPKYVDNENNWNLMFEYCVQHDLDFTPESLHSAAIELVRALEWKPEAAPEPPPQPVQPTAPVTPAPQAQPQIEPPARPGVMAFRNGRPVAYTNPQRL